MRYMDQSLGLPQVAEGLTYLSGRAECPDCASTVTVADQYAADNRSETGDQCERTTRGKGSRYRLVQKNMRAGRDAAACAPAVGPLRTGAPAGGRPRPVPAGGFEQPAAFFPTLPVMAENHP